MGHCGGAVLVAPGGFLLSISIIKSVIKWSLSFKFLIDPLYFNKTIATDILYTLAFA